MPTARNSPMLATTTFPFSCGEVAFNSLALSIGPNPIPFLTRRTSRSSGFAFRCCLCAAFSWGTIFRRACDAYLWVRFLGRMALPSNVWFPRLPADFALTAKLYAADYAHTENIHPASVKIEQMRIEQGT